MPLPRFAVTEMDPTQAAAIVDWHYAEPYAVYDLDGTAEAIAEVLDGSYFAVVTPSDAGPAETAGFFLLRPRGTSPRRAHRRRPRRPGSPRRRSRTAAGLGEAGAGVRPERAGRCAAALRAARRVPPDRGHL